MVLCEVVLLLSKVMVVISDGVALVFWFLVTVLLFVALEQVVLLLGFGVRNLVSDNFLCVSVESAESTERPFRIIGSFL